MVVRLRTSNSASLFSDAFRKCSFSTSEMLTSIPTIDWKRSRKGGQSMYLPQNCGSCIRGNVVRCQADDTSVVVVFPLAGCDGSVFFKLVSFVFWNRYVSSASPAKSLVIYSFVFSLSQNLARNSSWCFSNFSHIFSNCWRRTSTAATVMFSFPSFCVLSHMFDILIWRSSCAKMRQSMLMVAG